jgi:hypothetical protein
MMNEPETNNLTEHPSQEEWDNTQYTKRSQIAHKTKEDERSIRRFMNEYTQR